MTTDDPRYRLLALAQVRNVSLSELSRLIARNHTYLQQFVRKGSPRKLEETDRRTLARFFGIDEAELGAPEDIYSSGGGAEREHGLEPASLSTVAVTGDSMQPTLRDGDEILVDRTPRPLRDGVHVVRVDEALLVKRLETGRPGLITLISDNPAYRPIALRPRALEVIGRVVWKGGRL